MNRNKFFGITDSRKLERTSAFKKLEKQRQAEKKIPNWMLTPLSREEIRRIESVERPKEYYLETGNVMFRFFREKQIPKHLDVDYDPVTKKYWVKK